jgi:hydroxymethylglutaryl-CoA lyase
MALPTRVTITEVGPRDGLQSEGVWVDTAKKIALIDALARAGLPRIEATSFVHPKAIPNLRDAAEVMAGITRVPGVTYMALVPNLKGAERAAATPNVDMWVLFLSASESHNKANVNMTIDESLRGFEPVLALARQHGKPVRAVISTAFGCPYEGAVAPQSVIRIGRALRDLGVQEIHLGDTSGMANPRQVGDLIADFQAQVGRDVDLGLHLHDTRGLALANIVVGLQAGLTKYDAAIGGIGGCPYAPGATGNVSTEDLVHMLHEMGIETGVDLDALLACSRMIRELVGHEVPSHVAQAGPASRLAARVQAAAGAG